ncbi:lysophospholipid acyltransferase family protein [Desulfofustis limnaeus]|uniref:lysophospholipid acyltransferase family protein n=1 Tax=Desulfofustis limnaeus TaxID=2740163 RepID=UPI003F491781
MHSSVIVCNHVSYLDPLILISLYERHKTVVKTVFFKVPIFGWVLRHAGYFPADGGGRYGSMMIDQVEGMEEFLGGGGNFFIFPEGTRSRDGSLGALNRGALKIARLCRAPIQVVRLTNTGNLFIPGRFFFNTRQPNHIRLDLVASLDAGTVAGLSLAQLESRIEAALRFPDGAERSGNELAASGFRDDSTVKP